MRYFKSPTEDAIIKIDTDKNESFVVRGGKETKLPQHTKLVADALLANQEIDIKSK